MTLFSPTCDCATSFQAQIAVLLHLTSYVYSTLSSHDNSLLMVLPGYHAL
jgi:hypothetical protein